MKNQLMVGIEEIASYIPDESISNYDRKDKFGINDHFIEKKIGIRKVSVKKSDDDTSDLCVKAFNNLLAKNNLNRSKIQTLVVVTQNPDRNIPHTSAIVHGKLDLDERCACFDISLGCSGFIYGLSIIESFMLRNGQTTGVLITADPYSKIIDNDDKNTSLLFGDAAAATLISDKPIYKSGKFTFGTIGKKYNELTCVNGKLYMNGPAIFDFAVAHVPGDIDLLLAKNNLKIMDIDRFIIHQGSKFVVDTIAKAMKLSAEKVVFDIYDYGNTVSSSIPIILEKEIKNNKNKNILLSGFGVGLSLAGGILQRVSN